MSRKTYHEESECYEKLISVLESPNIPASIGIELINGIPQHYQVASEHISSDFDYWKDAALKAAQLNIEYLSSKTKIEIAQIRELAMQYIIKDEDDPKAMPLSYIGQALMKFCVHQLIAAFGTLHGLPPLGSDYGRFFSSPHEAIAEAFDGNYDLEQKVIELWQDQIKIWVKESDVKFEL